tara:strand:+ start:247 stop:420 length:174 start_codon:yes stop_codon:yes gene_type:complete
MNKNFEKKIIDFFAKNIVPTIKKDLRWLGNNIIEDLDKITKDNKKSKKMKNQNKDKK